jgi:hypothetical protein
MMRLDRPPSLGESVALAAAILFTASLLALAWYIGA